MRLYFITCLETNRMRLYILAVIVVCSLHKGYTQGRFVSKGDGQPALETKFSGVEGTPYWNDSFVEGETKSRQNGKWYQYPKARFDTYKNEFEYEQPSTAKLLRLDATQISEFKLNQATFRCGFPPIGEQGARHFYQVLYDQRTKLLKNIHTKMVSETEFGSVVKSSKFVREEELYIVKEEQIRRIKRKKSAVLEALSDKASTIAEFVKSNRLDYSVESDLIKILEFYDQETPVK